MNATWKEIKQKKHCYLWIAPFYILFAIFSLFPAIYGIGISLTKYNGFDAAKFIGLQNYINLFQDDLFWKSLWNTLVLWVLIVPSRTLIALVLAAALNSKKLLGRRIYSGVILLPYVTAAVVAAIVFRILLATQGGLVNNLLGSWFGIAPIGWLESTETSKLSIALMNIWRMSGYFSLVLLAGMQKISDAVNEAAELDGAGPISKFFYVTVPQMKSEIFFVMLMSTLWVFQNVGGVMLMTGGGPLNSSMNLIYYIYKNAYEYNKMGYASALSYVLFLIMMIFSWFSVKKHYSKED